MNSVLKRTLSAELGPNIGPVVAVDIGGMIVDEVVGYRPRMMMMMMMCIEERRIGVREELQSPICLENDSVDYWGHL